MLYTIDTIAPICHNLHAEGKVVVLATGFFDLLHVEHINFLTKAKAAGDILVVAVESDERARATKGEGRPIETQAVRCQKLAPYANFVIALPPDFDHFEAYDSLMSAVRPQIYAISSHTAHQKSKTFLVEKYGGKLLVVHEHNPEISTTKILENTKI
jgi:cytidyltransferase-like protein